MQDNLGESKKIGVQEQKIQGARYNLQKSPEVSDQRKVERDKGE